MAANPLSCLCAACRVFAAQGMVQRADGGLEREYSLVEQELPANVVVESVLEEDPRFRDRPPLSLEVGAAARSLRRSAVTP